MVKKFFAALTVFVLMLMGAEAKQRAIPRPRLKPPELFVEPSAPQAIVFPSPPLLSGWPKTVIEAEQKECSQRLKGLDITYETLAPMGRENGCGAPAPLLVSKISGLAIVPAAEMTCDLAQALHGWISSSVIPSARLELRKTVVRINNASAYVCRRRNGLATGKLSEHAKANALDIATLGFEDGSSISIKGDWSGLKQMIGMSAQGNFLRLIRRDACIRFTTVLGPGTDPYHGDHFHIDVARRKNGYRICQ